MICPRKYDVGASPEDFCEVSEVGTEQLMEQAQLNIEGTCGGSKEGTCVKYMVFAS